MRRRSGLNFNRQRRRFNMPLFKEVLSWIFDLTVVIAIAFLLVIAFGQRTSVVGQAMADSLKNKDQVLVNRLVYWVTSPKAGDVIVFLPNGNEKSHYYVRRVIGCPGDTVEIKDGAVFVNDEPYTEKGNVASMDEAGLASEPIQLQEGEYFVLGDNRNGSEDSRLANIGNVKKEYILGKAWLHFGGPSGFGRVQ